MNNPSSPANSLTELRDHLRAFVEERDWDQFQTPKNLAMALAGEAGELVAEFQWLTAEQSSNLTEQQLSAVGDEMADVLIYLIRLADTIDVDLVELASTKMVKNAQKYPANIVRGSPRKYTEYVDE